jgi:hypothetical protein
LESVVHVVAFANSLVRRFLLNSNKLANKNKTFEKISIITAISGLAIGKPHTNGLYI